MATSLPSTLGAESDGAILLVAHLDTLFPDGTEHITEVQPDRVVGASVADDSLGLAMLATLPHLLEHLGIALRSDLLLLGTTRSLGRGNLAGLRFFLENAPLPHPDRGMRGGGAPRPPEPYLDRHDSRRRDLPHPRSSTTGRDSARPAQS